MSSIKGAAEIVINVRDLAGMQAFYEDVLGFRFHSHFPEVEPTIVFLTIAELDSPLGRGGHPQMFALIDAKRHVFTRETFKGLDRERSPLNHLAFEIEESEYESEQQRLRDLGLEIQTTAFPNLQAKAIFFNDPEGNLLELICHHKTD